MEFLLRIISRFTRRGTDEAQSALKGTQDAASGAGQGMDEMSSAAREAEDATRDAGGAAQEMGAAGEEGGRRAGEGMRGAGNEARRAGEQARRGGFRRWMDGMGAAAGRLRGRLRAVSGPMRGFLALLGVGSLVAFSRRTLQLADDLDKLRQSTRLSAAEIQGLQFATRQATSAGVNVMDTALEAMASRMARLPDNFSRYGISVRKSTGEMRPLAEVIRMVADRVREGAETGDAFAVVQDTMGREARALVPLLQQGGEALDKWIRKNQEMRLGLTDEDIDRLAKANDQLDVAQSRIQAVLASPMATVADFWAGQAENLGVLISRHERAADQISRRGQDRIASIRLERDAATDAAELDRLRLRLQDELVTTQERVAMTTAQGRDEAAQRHTDLALSLAVELQMLDRSKDAILERNRAAREGAAAEADAAEAAEAAQRRYERAVELAELLADEAREAAQANLSIEERIEGVNTRLQEEIDLLESISEEGERQVAIANAKIVAESELTRLKELQAEQAERGRREEEAQQQALERERAQMDILRLRAAGEDEVADAKEHQLRVADRAEEMERRMGVSSAEALRMARERLALEQRVNDLRRQGGDETERRQTAEERRIQRLMQLATEETTAAGRNARFDLQKEGVLDRSTRVAQRQMEEFRRSGQVVAGHDLAPIAAQPTGREQAPEATPSPAAPEPAPAAPEAPSIAAAPRHDQGRDVSGIADRLRSMDVEPLDLSPVVSAIERHARTLASKAQRNQQQIEEAARRINTLENQLRNMREA